MSTYLCARASASRLRRRAVSRAHAVLRYRWSSTPDSLARSGAVAPLAAAMAAAPGARQRPLLAPASITRLSGQASEVRPDVWEVSMGEAVPAFVLANGPAKITNYNFLKIKGATRSGRGGSSSRGGRSCHLCACTCGFAAIHLLAPAGLRRRRIVRAIGRFSRWHVHRGMLTYAATRVGAYLGEHAPHARVPTGPKRK